MLKACSVPITSLIFSPYDRHKVLGENASIISQKMEPLSTSAGTFEDDQSAAIRTLWICAEDVTYSKSSISFVKENIMEQAAYVLSCTALASLEVAMWKGSATLVGTAFQALQEMAVL